MDWSDLLDGGGHGKFRQGPGDSGGQYGQLSDWNEYQDLLRSYMWQNEAEQQTYGNTITMEQAERNRVENMPQHVQEQYHARLAQKKIDDEARLRVLSAQFGKELSDPHTEEYIREQRGRALELASQD